MRAADMAAEDVYRMLYEVPQEIRPHAYWVMTRADLEILMDRLPLEQKGWPTHLVGRPIRITDKADGVHLAYPTLTGQALDLSDPLLRAMAERNHRPTERWTLGGDLMLVCCETCGQSWPCATRQALNSLCTCPDIDVSDPRAGEMPGTSTVKGLNPKCPQHGPNG